MPTSQPSRLPPRRPVPASSIPGTKPDLLAEARQPRYLPGGAGIASAAEEGAERDVRVPPSRPGPDRLTAIAKRTYILCDDSSVDQEDR